MSLRARWRHPVLRQWVWLVGMLLTILLVAQAFGLFWRTDLALYDALLPAGERQDDVVIVAVDDASIAALGRWPWQRSLHAALLDRLRAAGARAVALDFVLTEPDPVSPGEDDRLASAMSPGMPVVLPLLAELPDDGGPAHEELPIPQLTRAASGVGHVNLELDRDGIVRSVFLREGSGHPNRSQLALALLEATPGEPAVVLRGARHPALDTTSATRWVRDYQLLIPFVGPPGTVAHQSYADVLNGSVGAEAFRGKFVLVGATAQGVGDAYPTPRSGHARAMPGVEISANVLQALRGNRMISPVPLPVTEVIAALLLLVASAGVLRLSPRGGLLLIAGIATLTLAGSLLALRGPGWWWPPTTTFVTILALYPLWSWRRLEAAEQFLETELARFATQRLPLVGPAAGRIPSGPPPDIVQHRIDLVRQATRRLQAVHRLFADMVRSLPDATLLVDPEGRIVLANPAAATLFGATDAESLERTAVDSHLFRRFGRESLRIATLAANAPCRVEARPTSDPRDYIVRVVPFHDSEGTRIGVIVDLADISDLRAAQREREDVIRFLSHDMKSPASSLLGLAQLQRDPARALAPEALSQRLDVLAHRTLSLADGFIALAQAESLDPAAFEDFDLRDAVQDAYDEVWATAEARHIGIDLAVAPHTAVVHGDRQLLARALVNLLNNAVKFSPDRAHVEVRSESRGTHWAIAIHDAGPGIAPDRQPLLFKRFSRSLHYGDADPGGAGLGLAFVHVVAEKHGGQVEVDSAVGRGSVFTLSLPANPRNDAAA